MLDLPSGMEGRRIDRYLIVQRLGAGGFGTVFLAKHTVLGTEVALKLLSPKYAEQPDVVERFLREAKAAAAIGNPHIVSVSDAGVYEGLPFLAMELLRGEDLEQRITRRGVLPVPLALDIAIQVLEGLGAAHARGIVHRDMKPANVFLIDSPSGSPFVKLLDFGVSKIIDPSVQRLTQTGVTLGTPAYMAPEQLTNTRDVDHRADLFAVGVIVFETVTGQLPYAAETFVDLMSRMTGQAATRLDRYLPSAPAELVEVLARAMATDPNERFQSCDELKRALSRVRDGGTGLTTGPMTGLSPAPSFGAVTPQPAFATTADPPKYLANSATTPQANYMTPAPTYSSPFGVPPATPPPSFGYPTPPPYAAPSAPTSRLGMWLWIGGLAILLPLSCIGAGVAMWAVNDKPDPPAPDIPIPRAPDPPPVFPQFPQARDMRPIPPPPPQPAEPTVVPIPAGADPCTVPVTHDVTCDRAESIHMPEECRVTNGRELHVLGSYSPANGDGVVRVDVMRTAAPIVLVLGSYQRTTWDVHVAEGASIERVIVSGYQRSEVTGLPEGVRVDWRGGSVGRGYPPASFDWEGLSDMFSGRRLAEAAEQETGLSTRAFAGCYSPTRFVIGQLAP